MEPGATNCDIVIQGVEPEDYGTWMCLVQEGENFENDRRTVNIEVGQKADIGFEFEAVGKERNELVITEGETAEVRTHKMASKINFVSQYRAKVD